ncbi:MAG: hypothetical protein AABM67_06385 [Acidobacteriota bacterium]
MQEIAKFFPPITSLHIKNHKFGVTFSKEIDHVLVVGVLSEGAYRRKKGPA